MLLLAVDDATGRVASALLCEYENTHDYFLLMRVSRAAIGPEASQKWWVEVEGVSR